MHTAWSHPARNEDPLTLSPLVSLARRVVPPSTMRFIGRSLDIRAAARGTYGVRWLPLQRRAMALRRDHGWSLAESLDAGLLDPHRPVDLGEWVAPRRISEAQEALNSRRIELVGEHKAAFRMLTEAAGIPVPRTYAAFMRGTMGWSWAANRAIPDDGWAQALEALPDEFILKPAEGYHGKGVRAIERGRFSWRSLGEGHLTTGRLVELMRGDPDFGDWIAQERVRNHPDLGVLGGSGLHTLRLAVVIGVDGAPQVIWAGFRIAVGESPIDNFSGNTGNLSCEIDLDTGTVTRVFQGRTDAPGLEPVATHPVTGMTLRGFRLPLWDDAVDAALRAAPVFLPLRTMGFDIGLTPAGPSIVEMNQWYDLPPNAAQARDLLARLWREAGHPDGTPAGTPAPSRVPVRG